LADALRRIVPTDACDGVSADVNDLLEISRWLLARVSNLEGRLVSPDSLETFLIELDVQLDHLRFHVDSLKPAITAALAGLPSDE
jgi:hypothetical protein